MYIGYLHDQKRLGFSCIKDIRAAKLILNLKKFLKRTKRLCPNLAIQTLRRIKAFISFN